MRFFLLIFFTFYFPIVQGAESLCDVLNLPNCKSVSKMGRRASAQSVPSVSTAAQFNPANVSQDRGFGIETFYAPGNPAAVSMVTGTGKMGFGLISGSTENSFFGNHVPEIEDLVDERYDNGKRYTSHKVGLGLSAAIFKRKWGGLDLGVIGRYNPDTKKFHPGVGSSVRLGILTFGYSYYNNDVKLKTDRNYENPRTGNTYYNEWNGFTYEEKFFVQSYFVGLKIKNLFLDAGQFVTKYKFGDSDDPTIVRLYSSSLIFGRWLFNLAYRVEDSPLWKYNGEETVEKQKQSAMYGGLQFSLNKFIVLGAHYNYYLMKEASGSLTIFF